MMPLTRLFAAGLCRLGPPHGRTHEIAYEFAHQKATERRLGLMIMQSVLAFGPPSAAVPSSGTIQGSRPPAPGNRSRPPPDAEFARNSTGTVR